MSAYVLMAWDGPREHSESWHPVAVFDHEPTLMERGRALVLAQRQGILPWSTVRGEWGETSDGTTIDSVTQVERVLRS